MKKEDLKIVFLGTPDFAVESLNALVEGGYNVVAVVTATDKPAGRGHKLLPSAVKKYAVEKGLKVLQPERLKDETFVNELRALDADLFIVIAFRMLPEVVWQMPRLGTFNLHASLLPKYRGAAPINRAVMNGETVTGVTTFFLKHEIDTGDIIARESIEIGPDENVGSVHDRLMHIGARLTVDTVDAIIAGTLSPIPQDSVEGVTPTPAPKIFREDCEIRLSLTAQQVHNHVRGLSPYPCAWIELPLPNGTTVTAKILATKLPTAGQQCLDGNGTTLPIATGGSVTFTANRMWLNASDASLKVLSIHPAGKRPMPTADYLRGL